VACLLAANCKTGQSLKMFPHLHLNKDNMTSGAHNCHNKNKQEYYMMNEKHRCDVGMLPHFDLNILFNRLLVMKI
jgi:hypothetical protein